MKLHMASSFLRSLVLNPKSPIVSSEKRGGHRVRWIQPKTFPGKLLVTEMATSGFHQAVLAVLAAKFKCFCGCFASGAFANRCPQTTVSSSSLVNQSLGATGGVISSSDPEGQHPFTGQDLVSCYDSSLWRPK